MVKRASAVLAIVVAVITGLFYLGVLPWATRAEVKELKQDHGAAIGRIDQRVDDIHRIFFPRADREARPGRQP